MTIHTTMLHFTCSTHVQHTVSQVLVAQPCSQRMDWVIWLMTETAPRVRVLYPSTTITKQRERETSKVGKHRQIGVGDVQFS